jgi:glycosyltransferase 2 family protein
VRVQSSSRRRLFAVAKLVLSLGLLSWLVVRMLERDGVATLRDRLGHLDFGFLLVAIALHGAAVLAGTARWSLLLRAARIELPFSFLLRSFLIGRFVGAFTPSTSGLDGFRLWEAGRASGSMGKSAAAIVVEKLTGLLSMAIVCAALALLAGQDLLGPSALLFCALFGGGALLLLVLLRRADVLAPLATRVPRLQKALDALAQTRLSPAQLGVAIGLGVLSHLALSAVFWATARSLSVSIDAAVLFTVGNAIVLAVLLPISVGGVGVRESVAVVLLAGVGIGSTDAVLIALLGYLTGQVPAIVGGVLSIAKKSVKESDPKPELAEQPIG